MLRQINEMKIHNNNNNIQNPLPSNSTSRRGGAVGEANEQFDDASVSGEVENIGDAGSSNNFPRINIESRNSVDARPLNRLANTRLPETSVIRQPNEIINTNNSQSVDVIQSSGDDVRGLPNQELLNSPRGFVPYRRNNEGVRSSRYLTNISQSRNSMRNRHSSR